MRAPVHSKLPGHHLAHQEVARFACRLRDDIDHILKLIDSSDFDELKLEMGDLKLELR